MSKSLKKHGRPPGVRAAQLEFLRLITENDDVEKVIDLIFETIDKFNNEYSNEIQLEKSSHTALLGRGSKLDSLGLINLIVAVEQNVEDKFDITITLADERAMSQEISPFRTVGSLADYIEMILVENKNV